MSEYFGVFASLGREILTWLKRGVSIIFYCLIMHWVGNYHIFEESKQPLFPQCHLLCCSATLIVWFLLDLFTLLLLLGRSSWIQAIKHRDHLQLVLIVARNLSRYFIKVQIFVQNYGLVLQEYCIFRFLNLFNQSHLRQIIPILDYS